MRDRLHVGREDGLERRRRVDALLAMREAEVLVEVGLKRDLAPPPIVVVLSALPPHAKPTIGDLTAGADDRDTCPFHDAGSALLLGREVVPRRNREFSEAHTDPGKALRLRRDPHGIGDRLAEGRGPGVRRVRVEEQRVNRSHPLTIHRDLHPAPEEVAEHLPERSLDLSNYRGQPPSVQAVTSRPDDDRAARRRQLLAPGGEWPRSRRRHSTQIAGLDFVDVEIAIQDALAAEPGIYLDAAGVADGAIREAHAVPARAGAVVESARSTELQCRPQEICVHAAAVVEDRDRRALSVLVGGHDQDLDPRCPGLQRVVEKLRERSRRGPVAGVPGGQKKVALDDERATSTTGAPSPDQATILAGTYWPPARPRTRVPGRRSGSW